MSDDSSLGNSKNIRDTLASRERDRPKMVRGHRQDHVQAIHFLMGEHPDWSPEDLQSALRGSEVGVSLSIGFIRRVMDRKNGKKPRRRSLKRRE